MIGDSMETKIFEEYEDIGIIIDGERKETIIYIESTEQADLKDLPVAEEK